MITIGVIGYGSFGAFACSKLAPHALLRVYDRQEARVPPNWRASLKDVATSDYVFLTVPLAAYEAVLEDIQPLLTPDSVVIDVCSVKVRPIEKLHSLLPGTKIVATHPLFGPESAAQHLEGHTFVVCPEVSDATATKTVIEFAEKLGLHVVQMSADEHDREMATVHALTFFIAQGLINIDINDAQLHTPSFKKLLTLADLERHHSEDLFQTIQAGNPYASEVRQKFLDAATKLHQSV